MRRSVALLVLALAVTPEAVAADAEAEGLPLGHADFLPSPTRPVGYLGDGSGSFPGASPVTEWDHGTGHNILWRTELPFCSCGSCIVVGDRVFTMAEPDELYCLDAATGEVLWRRWVDPLAELMPEWEARRVRGAILRHAYASGAFSRRGNVVLPGESSRSKEGLYDVLVKYLPGDEPFARFVRRVAEIKSRPYHEQDEMILPLKSETTDQMTEGMVEIHSVFGRRGVGGYEGWIEGRNPLWVGETFNPPVSDGISVYVRVAQNGVACFDLEGVRRWVKWLDGKPHNACPSPMFVYGELVYVPFDNTAYVLDARTGRVRVDIRASWTDSKGKARGFAGGIYHGTKDVYHSSWGLMPFRFRGEDCLLGRKAVYRAATAEKVCDVTGCYPDAACIIRGDRLYSCSQSYSKENKGLHAWRLAEKDGALVAEKLYHNRHGVGSWRSVAEANGYVFSFTLYPEATVLRADTGETVGKIGWDRRNPGPNRFGRRALEGDTTNFAVTAGKGLVYATNWSGQTLVIDASGASPRAVSFNQTEPVHGSWPYFQGNRFYLRAFFHIYCIGDPDKEYAAPRDWQRPGDVPDLTAADAETLLDALRSDRAAMRLAAAKALAGKDGRELAPLVDALGERVASDDFEEVRLALARSLGRASGAAGKTDAVARLLAHEDDRLALAGLVAAEATGADAAGLLGAVSAAGGRGCFVAHDRRRLALQATKALVSICRGAMGESAVEPLVAEVGRLWKTGVRDRDRRKREAAHRQLCFLVSSIGGLREKGRRALPFLRELVAGSLKGPATDGDLFAAALPAVCRVDADAGLEEAKKALESLEKMRWRRRDSEARAFVSCDARVVPFLVEKLNGQSERGKSTGVVAVWCGFLAEHPDEARPHVERLRKLRDEYVGKKRRPQWNSGAAVDWALRRITGEKDDLRALYERKR